MKKRNKPTKLYWLIPLIVAVLWFTVGAKAGIVQNSTSGQTGQDSISIGFDLLDSLGNPVIVDSAQDWGCMITYYPGGLVAVVDSFLLDGTTNAQVRWNANHFRGLQSWNYRRQISDLDGTPVNGTYSYRFIVRDSSLHLFTTYRGEFTVYQTAEFATVLDQIKYDTDSLVFGATLDNPSFLSPTTASRTLDVSATGEAGVDWANVGSPTTTVGLTNTTVGTVTSATTSSASNTAIGLATWNTSYGTAFTGGSMGDSLNGMQYSKVSQLIVANVDAAISSRGTSTLTATDNIGINWADVSNPTSTVGLTNTTVGTVTTTTTATNLTNAPTNGDLTATMKTSVSAATWGAATSSYVGAGTFGNMANRDSIRIKEIIDSLDTQAWASTSAGSGVDSAVVSRILRRMWGIQLGAAGSTDSVTYSQRLAALIFIDSLVRKGLGDTVATFADSAVIARSVFDNDVVPLASRTVNTTQFGGTAVTGRDLGASVLISPGTGTGQLSVTSGVVSANATQISGDGTAADNAESFFDGTGYAGTNNVIPLVTTTTTATNLTNAPTAGDLTATMKASIGTQVWTTSNPRILTALDEDATTIDLNASTIGTATTVGTVNALANNSITALAIADDAIDSASFADDAKKMIAIRADSGAAGGTGLDSATTSRIVKRTVWGVGGGSSGSDSTTLAQRTATATGTVTADVYPLLGPKFVVDAVGTDGNSQFVVDTTSLGVFSSDQDAIINRTIIIRSLSGDEVSLPTTINRVAYTGANCSLTVNIDVPKNFAANDTIQFTGLPWHDFATVAEASDSNVLALLAADTTGHGGDATIGGAIVAEKSDTAKVKTMMTNMGVPRGLDSLASLSETATADGTVRRGEVITTDDSLFVKGGRVDSVTATDTVLTATAVNLGSDSVFVKGGVIDTARNASGVGGTCTGTGAYADTIYVFDGATAVSGIRVTVYNSDESAIILDGNRTNDNGRIILNLDAATYKIRVAGRGVTQTTNPQSQTVTSSGANDTVQVNLPAAPFTYLFGQEIYPDTLKFAVVELELTNYTDTAMSINGQPISPQFRYTARTDSTGSWEIPNVIANELIDEKSRYVFRVKSSRLIRPKTFEVYVPDTASVSIEDLY